MSKAKNLNLLLLIGFFVIFLILRSVYYTEHLNFSADQGVDAQKVLSLYREHKIPLIGPFTSLQYNGRLLFQGPAYYYLLFVFLYIGKFDPIISSYLFTIFCGLMIFPLFYGLKMLTNKKVAYLMVITYAFFPYYVEYTRFHWNTTYLLSLLPLLVLFMGLYKKYKSKWLFLLISSMLGFLLQFHYQFILIIFGFFIYYFYFVRVKLYYVFLFILGLLIGFSPLILFEFRNQFYNIQTIILYINHRNQLQSGGNLFTTPHYYLSISFMGLIIFYSLIAKYLPSGKNFKILLTVLALIFISASALINFHKPEHSFWSYSTHWNYPDEYKVYTIIKSQHLKNYNVANMTYYDVTSDVIKFLLKRDGVNINYTDYYHNKYLFIIAAHYYNYMSDPAYEVNTFKPSKVLKVWKINSTYNLYLRERL